MTELGDFLPPQFEHHADAKRYLLGLLTKSLPKLEKESAVLSADEAILERKLDAQAIEQSKVCFHSSQDLGRIKRKCRDFRDLSTSVQSLFSHVQTEMHGNEGQLVVQMLDKLKAVKGQQAALSEVLEIPNVLHTLHSAGMYEDMLSLLRYAKELASQNSSPLIQKLAKDAAVYQQLLETSILGELANTLDHIRTQKALRLTGELLGLSETELCTVYLQHRSVYFTQKTDMKLSVSAYLTNYCTTLKELILALLHDSSVFPLCVKSIYLFIFDRAIALLDVLQEKLPGVERLSELREISAAVKSLNSEGLIRSGIGLTDELNQMLESAICAKIIDFAQRIKVNFEGMLRLYQWDNSGQKANPLLKFGGIAVLYNNCVYLLNEVRQHRSVQVQDTFCTAVTQLFAGVVEYTLQRGQHLRGPGPRTTQQNVYRNLFFEFVEIMRRNVFPPLMSAVKDTFPEVDLQAQFVLSSQEGVLKTLQEVDTSS